MDISYIHLIDEIHIDTVVLLSMKLLD